MCTRQLHTQTKILTPSRNNKKFITSEVKGKAAPLQGPGGSRKLRFPDLMTTAQDCGKVVSLTHQPPFPQEMLLVLISVRR